MNLLSTLTGSHLRTYEAIFQHPLAHNLGWHDVHTLLRYIGEVVDEPNGNLKVTRHGEILVLHPVRTKEVSTSEEVLALRHFLQRAEKAAANVQATGDWLVVIDHHEARIYRTATAGTVPQVIRPHAPDDFFRHAPDSKDFSRGQEKPDPNSYFSPVASLLRSAQRILVFGHGTGNSNEMDQFMAWLNKNHADLARRIIGCVRVDEHHRTESQLLALARETFVAPVALLP